MATLEFFGMFDYAKNDTDIYEYTSMEWSEFIKIIASNGVSSTSFETTVNGLVLTIGAGVCVIEGRYGYNKNSVDISLEPEEPTTKRIDRLVLEANINDRKIELKVLKGIAAASPTAPELTQTNLLFQIPLYQALITDGSTVTLTDERLYNFTSGELMEAYNKILSEFNKIKSGETKVLAVYA